MKDKESGNYSVFFQSKDAKVMDKAFTKAIENVEKKHDRKESTLKKLKSLKKNQKLCLTRKTKLRTSKRNRVCSWR